MTADWGGGASEARNAAQLPTDRGTRPDDRAIPPNASGAEVEKPRSRPDLQPLAFRRSQLRGVASLPPHVFAIGVARGGADPRPSPHPFPHPLRGGGGRGDTPGLLR